MLYNPDWKTDVFTLEGLIEWLEKQPAGEGYNYSNCAGGCMYGLYTASRGIQWEKSGASTFDGSYPKERDVFCSLVYDRVAGLLPWTFGAALERARKCQS